MGKDEDLIIQQHKLSKGGLHKSANEYHGKLKTGKVL